jgi:hypothetical protein
MPSKIKPKRSFTAGAVPTTSDLDANELAINWVDSKAFTKTASGNIVSVTLGGGGGSNEDAGLRALFVPPPPTGLAVTAGNASALLSWTAPTGVIAQAPINDYREQYSTDNGTTWTTFTGAAASTATTATVTGLTNGTSYRFRVAGVNAAGVGAFTAASSAVTAGAFSPASLANLAMWLDASVSTSLYDSTSGGSLVSGGGTVQRWQDRSGNGNHATGLTGPTRSLAAVNGLDALSFSSSLLRNTSLNVSGSSQSLFMVVKFASGSFQIAGGFGTASSFGALLIESNRSAGTHSATFGGSGSENQAAGGSSSNATKSFGAVLGGGTGSLIINGTTAATVSRDSVSSGSGLTLGSYYDIVPLSGLLCEVVYLPRTVTAGEISNLQTYFAAKWGL